ncbi:unnamed protein product, partial [Scytosiphon promiscuus]
VSSSPADGGVARMMGSLSIRDQRQPAGAGRRYGGGGELEQLGGGGQAREAVGIADEYDLVAGSRGAGGGGGTFGFLDTPPPSNYDLGREDEAQLQQQQQQQQQQQPMGPPPLLPRRGVGGSPSLAPQRKRFQREETLDIGAFSPNAVSAANAASAAVAGPGAAGVRNATAVSIDNMHGIGVDGAGGSAAGGGLLRWSFPPRGMSGDADGAGGVPLPPALSRLGGLERLGGGEG